MSSGDRDRRHFTGLVLGLQGYYVLHRFGSESLLGALVS
jgi:phospholipid/cholesterol/gamma-HCH transport system permease protein